MKTYIVEVKVGRTCCVCGQMILTKEKCFALTNRSSVCTKCIKQINEELQE